MANFALRAIARAPGLKRLPVLKLLAIAEIAALARNHANKLTPTERRRMLAIANEARIAHKLTPELREELTALVMKAEPRIFAGEAADRFSPIPLPRRIKHGPKRKRQPV